MLGARSLSSGTDVVLPNKKINILKIKKIPIIYLFCINIIFTQEKYLSPDDVKVEWKNYTSFQRQELVNFATFLFDEQFYERALLVFFQFLYKYPGDELEIAAYFNIAKCSSR